jgi:hypothetical protein
MVGVLKNGVLEKGNRWEPASGYVDSQSPDIPYRECEKCHFKTMQKHLINSRSPFFNLKSLKLIH